MKRGEYGRWGEFRSFREIVRRDWLRQGREILRGSWAPRGMGRNGKTLRLERADDNGLWRAVYHFSTGGNGRRWGDIELGSSPNRFETTRAATSCRDGLRTGMRWVQLIAITGEIS